MKATLLAMRHSIGDKIRNARESQTPPWSQADLEKATGRKGLKHRIGYLETTPSAKPREGDVEAIAVALGIPVDWFFDGRDSPVPSRGQSAHLIARESINAERLYDDAVAAGMSVMVAVRSWRGALAGSDPNDEEPFVQEEYPAEMPSAFLIGGVRSLDRHELLRVVGFSMAPRIMPGERVLVYIDSVPRVGAIVMAESPTRSVYLKVLRRKHERFWLESINPKGPQDIPLDGWKIHGYAIAIMGDPGSTESGRNIEWAFGQPLRA